MARPREDVPKTSFVAKRSLNPEGAQSSSRLASKAYRLNLEDDSLMVTSGEADSPILLVEEAVSKFSKKKDLEAK